VAWKRWNIWALCEVEHFEKHVTAYHLEFNKAIKETLMGSLFGDILVHIDERFEFFIEATTEAELPSMPDIIPEGGYRLTITNAGFMVDQKVVGDVSPEILWAFHTAASKDKFMRLEQQKVRITFTPESQSIFSLSHFWNVVATFPHDDDKLDWETILRTPLKMTADGVRDKLRNEIGKGTVKYVFEVEPQTTPEFLLKREGSTVTNSRATYASSDKVKSND
jgi:hypothetical protein